MPESDDKYFVKYTWYRHEKDKSDDKYFVKYTWYRHEKDKPTVWHDECKGFKRLADALWCTTDTLAKLHSPLNYNVVVTHIQVVNKVGDCLHFWTIG